MSAAEEVSALLGYAIELQDRLLDSERGAFPLSSEEATHVRSELRAIERHALTPAQSREYRALTARYDLFLAWLGDVACGEAH